MKAIAILKEILIFVVLVLLQAILLNRIGIFGVATPILYIYFLIKLPFGRNKFYVIISGFLLGLIIDIFLNTPGINAAATTIVAAFRNTILFLYYPKDEIEEAQPNIFSSTWSFVKYTITMVIFHQILLFFIEAFSFFNIIQILIRIGTSSLVTTILILSLDSLNFKKDIN